MREFELKNFIEIYNFRYLEHKKAQEECLTAKLFDTTELFLRLRMESEISLEAKLFSNNITEEIISEKNHFDQSSSEGELRELIINQDAYDFFLYFENIEDPKVKEYIPDISKGIFSTLARAYIENCYIWSYSNHITHRRKTKNKNFFTHLMLSTEIMAKYNPSFILMGSELEHDITEERLSDEADEKIDNPIFEEKLEALHKLNLLVSFKFVKELKLDKPYEEVMKHFIAVQHDILNIITHDKRKDYMHYIEDIVNPVFIRPEGEYNAQEDKSLEMLKGLKLFKDGDLESLSRELHYILRDYARDEKTVEANKRRVLEMKIPDIGANGNDLPLKKNKADSSFTASEIIYHCVKSNIIMMRSMAKYYSTSDKSQNTWRNNVYGMMKENVETYKKPTRQVIEFLKSKLNSHYVRNIQDLLNTYIKHGDIHKINLEKYEKRGKDKISKARSVFDGTLIEYIGMICKFKEKEQHNNNYKQIFGVALIAEYFYNRMDTILEEIKSYGKISQNNQLFLNMINPDVEEKIRKKFSEERRESL